VLVRKDGFPGESVVSFSGCGNHDPINVFPREDIVESKAGVHPGILFLEAGEDCLVLVADEL